MRVNPASMARWLRWLYALMAVVAIAIAAVAASHGRYGSALLNFVLAGVWVALLLRLRGR